MKKIILLAVMACVILISCSKGDEQFDATGTFEATEILVSAEQNGKILSLDIEEGQKLDVGERVGVIDTMQLYLKKLQLLSNAQSLDLQRPDILKQVASIKEQIIQAKKDQQRQENLIKANAGNQKDLDDINAKIKILSSQLEAQNSSLQKSNESLNSQTSGVRIQVMQLDDQLTKCYISSPISGIVLTKYANRGEYTIIGKALFKIADINNMYLRAYITNEQLTKIKLSQKVKVYVDKGNKDYKEYSGIISWISSSAEFTPKTIQTKDERQNLVYAIKILVHNDGIIKEGMYGQVKF
jgi:HlyD family secretion protein